MRRLWSQRGVRYTWFLVGLEFGQLVAGTRSTLLYVGLVAVTLSASMELYSHRLDRRIAALTDSLGLDPSDPRAAGGR